MKILSLNTWGGRLYEPLAVYIARQSTTVDVFCFQEVWRSRRRDTTAVYRSALFADLSRLLPAFRGTFCMAQQGYGLHEAVDYDLSWGLALFVRKELVATSRTGHFFISGYRNAMFDIIPSKRWRGKKVDDPSFVRLRKAAFTKETEKYFPDALHYIVIGRDTPHPLTISHMHGIWWPGTKGDSPERITQSKKIISGLARLPGRKVLCGDFNLMPDTRSIRMIEKAGYRNLIKEYGIADTRGSVNHARYPNEKPLQTYADYCFVTPDVRVKNFDVPQVSVSDHLPLILSFS